jgi:hypothetical protein
MQVLLRRADGLVTHHSLHQRQVTCLCQEIGGEGVTCTIEDDFRLNLGGVPRPVELLEK